MCRFLEAESGVAIPVSCGVREEAGGDVVLPTSSCAFFYFQFRFYF